MSDVVFLYGPPASGKFSVGTELAELTGYSLFHNHLTVDAVHPVFPEAGEWRHRALMSMRYAMLDLASEAGRDIIFTLAYSGAVDYEQIDAIIEAVEGHGGRVCFVQLYAPPEKLMERASANHRVKMGKTSTAEGIANTLASRDAYARIKHEPHLRIDTTTCTPTEAAITVIHYYHLPTVDIPTVTD